MIRILLAASLCLGGALLRADPATAQAYPDRPIKMIVPFPAGGPTDGMARIVADRLGTVLGQSIVIENKGGGAGGSIGAKFVAAADPDGYTILITPGGSLTTGPAVHKNIGYDPVKAFVPVAQLIETPLVISVHPSAAGEDDGRARRPTPRPIPARSVGARRASAWRRICCSNCSSSKPASTSCTCPIAARRRCSPPSWPAKSRSSPTR